MLTSVKMEEEQLDDYSFSILEGILPQVIFMMVYVMVMVMVWVTLRRWPFHFRQIIDENHDLAQILGNQTGSKNNCVKII